MKHSNTLIRSAFLLIFFTLIADWEVCAQGTAFSYQGRLNSGGAPAVGLYDFRFRLANDILGNSYTGSSFLTNGVAVSNGLFTTTIDFGSGIFTGASYWLEVDVRTNGGGAYTALNPFQPLTSTPYSIYATAATSVSGPVSAGQLSGAIASGNLSGTYGNSVTLNNPNNNFSGNGTGVTNVNAALLGGLTPSNFWQLNGNNVGAGQFVGSTNSQPLVMKVNNKQAVRYEDSPDTPNIVGGFSGNTIGTNVPGGTIGGGGTLLNNQPNIITNGGDYGTIAGGYHNFISGYGGSIVGGSVNSVTNSFGFVGGGQFNVIGGQYGSIGGGVFNTNSGYAAAIVGGYNNHISYGANYSTIAGGFDNNIQTNAGESFIYGGYNNNIGSNAAYSSILGGYSSGVYASSGIAAGVGAIVNHAGSTVMSDAQVALATSSNTNEFTIRAQNGLRLLSDVGVHLSAGDRPIIVRDWDVFSTNAPSYKSGIGRWGLFMEQANLIMGIPSNDISPRWFRVAKYSTNGDYASLMTVDQSGNVTATTFNGSGAGLDNINPSSLSSGSITAALNFSNSGNTFVGNGTGVSNVNAATLSGLPSSAFAKLNSSPVFTGTVSANDLSLASVARIAGLVRLGSETNTAEPPNLAGLVLRRIISTVVTSNSVVALARDATSTANVSLTRDGTVAGFVIQYPASPGNVTIACMGIDSTGAQKNFFSALSNPATAGVVQIYTNSQQIVHFECTFGNTYNAGQLTQVTLSRFPGDSYWCGTVTSTYNQ